MTLGLFSYYEPVSETFFDHPYGAIWNSNITEKDFLGKYKVT